MKITEKQIQELKKKHGSTLFLITVDDKSCILRKPKRQDLSYIGVVKDPMQASETLLRQLWVDGDKEILEDDELFLAVCNKMDEVIKVKEAEIKKL